MPEFIVEWIGRWQRNDMPARELLFFPRGTLRPSTLQSSILVFFHLPPGSASPMNDLWMGGKPSYPLKNVKKSLLLWHFGFTHLPWFLKFHHYHHSCKWWCNWLDSFQMTAHQSRLSGKSGRIWKSRVPDRREIPVEETKALKRKQVPQKIGLPVIQLHLGPEPLPPHQGLVLILPAEVILFSVPRKNHKLKITGKPRLMQAYFTTPDTTVLILLEHFVIAWNSEWSLWASYFLWTI